jgi:hypothetical protein
MSARKSTIIVLALITFAVIAFGVLLLDPFDAVHSFSVVAEEDGGNASPLAASISQAMFVIMEVAAVGFGVWFCFRAVKRRKETPQSRR